MIGARGKGLSITAGIAAALLPGAIWAQMTTGGAGEVSGAGGAPLSTLSAQQPALAPLATPLSDRMVLGDRTPEQPPLQSVAPDTTGDSLGQPFTPSSATADAATVLADRMILQADNTLIASGGVVVWYQDARLVASRIIVNGDSGDLTIEGPIHLSRPGVTDPGRDAIVIADSAQLDRKLQDGIIRGARLIIARELQLAARQATRSGEGRFTRLDRVVASACLVSPQNPTPLWEIRARSITHDAQTRLITFENPQLRAFGIPIAATPFTITAPDPTVDRKSGFLRPEIRTTSNLGFGVKIPYFQTLSDQADLTITPYVSANRTRTLELRYRQAFARGVTEWNGAISRDDIMPGKTRGYVFGNAAFDLPRGYRLGIQVQAASDRGYLLDYGITDADRLWSGISLERITREKLFFGRVGNYESLRDDENNAASPAQVADVIWQRRFVPDLIGGQGLMEWSAHAHRRPSDADQVGRDVARGSVGLDWRRQEILPGGLVGAAIAGLDADLYRIAQDSRYDDVETRVDPRIGVELRWPLIGGSGGATHLVEPVAQLLWSPPGSDKEIPNEDSRLIEFDEGNLFSDNRFPGYDARETGLRANLGLSWTRIDPTGWSLGLTAGRVLRNRPDRAFAPDSPLAGRRSDWLLAANYDSGNGLAIANRALFDDDFNISRNELRLGLLRPDLQVSAGHLWIDSDAAEGRDSDISELTGNVGWQVRRGWWANAETRYDFVADRAQSASLDLAYRNECLTMEMGVSRRFTASDSVRPETSFDLSVRLGGFGRSDDASGTVARRTCMR